MVITGTVKQSCHGTCLVLVWETASLLSRSMERGGLGNLLFLQMVAVYLPSGDVSTTATYLAMGCMEFCSALARLPFFDKSMVYWDLVCQMKSRVLFRLYNLTWHNVYAG